MSHGRHFSLWQEPAGTWWTTVCRLKEAARGTYLEQSKVWVSLKPGETSGANPHKAYGIQSDPGRIAAISNMREPTCVSDVRQYLEMVNQLSKFTPHLANITNPWEISCQRETSGVGDRPREKHCQRLKQLWPRVQSWHYLIQTSLSRCLFIWPRCHHTSKTTIQRESTSCIHFKIFDLNRRKICTDRKRSIGTDLGLWKILWLPYWFPFSHRNRSQTVSTSV